MHFSSSSRAPGVLAREDRPPEVSTTSRMMPTSSPRRVNTVLPTSNRSDGTCLSPRKYTVTPCHERFGVPCCVVRYCEEKRLRTTENDSQEERGSASVTQHVALVVALDPYRETIHGLLTLLITECKRKQTRCSAVAVRATL